MKKFLVTVVVGMLLFYTAAFAEPFTIRNGISFGNSKSQVTALETFMLSDTSYSVFSSYETITPYLTSTPVIKVPTEYLIFGPGTIAGIPDSYVEYHFQNDSLIGFAYLFRREKGNVTADYDMISSALRSKYGEPISDGKYNVVGIARFADDISRYVISKPPRHINEWVIKTEDSAVVIEHLMCINTGTMDTHWAYYFDVETSDIVEVDSGDL